MNTILQYIGTISSKLKNIDDCPRQADENAPEASIIVYPEFAEGVKDIKPGDEILLLTWLHMGDRTVLQTRPRNNPNAPLTGIFSTRSPDRPNPVGIHSVKVISITDGKIKVDSLEVLDQTPVIDIKPIWNTKI
ncbi:MAG: tRNA (N6-threonylcarbamoyladenosine(37)-N6)-methyltransferase TrmO [Bacteroidetes bacterium]|jgi:tRNA-Thr(GGU) m(6)t(6)A37 methyltransferase TsaA|nr:tRNA (N6-threonylcarbamoyladenosine(37)-N6)-methyltransferase TrmO [Bacteroidota bacterium]